MQNIVHVFIYREFHSFSMILVRNERISFSTDIPLAVILKNYTKTKPK